MKNKLTVQKFLWLLAIVSVSALWLSACQSTEEHPGGGHATKEHPEHPTNTNAPAKTP